MPVARADHSLHESFRLPSELHRQLEALARREYSSVSQIIRRAVAREIEHQRRADHLEQTKGEVVS